MFEIWHVWIIVGIFLWIIEIFTSSFVVGIFGTACFIVSPFAFANITFKIQLFIFGITTAIISLRIRSIMLKLFYRSKTKINTNVDALIDMSGIVIETIDNFSGNGRVKIGGEIWRAVTRDNNLKITIGNKIIVRAIEGCKVIVEPINQ